ncbi:forkhead box protein N4-like [Argonauta hians]
MALKNSKTGSLPVSEIYNFMTKNFPYFKNAPGGWKNSVRHNLSLNKCFEKVENPKLNGSSRKGCLWALNPAKISKMEEEIAKWEKKDPQGIRNSMANPERLELIIQGRVDSPQMQIFPNLSNIINIQPTHRVHTEQTNILPGCPSQYHIQSPFLAGSPAATQLKHVEIMEQNNSNLLKEAGAVDSTLSFDPTLPEITLKNFLDPTICLQDNFSFQNSLWDEDMDVELSLDMPVAISTTNSGVQSLGASLTKAGSHINLYSSLQGIPNESLTVTGFGHSPYNQLDVSGTIYGQNTLSIST